MARLTVPVVATVIGEGGSGGALALAVADRVLMQENATYSVITPEGCAAILWRDAAFAPQAAEALKPTASRAARARRRRARRRRSRAAAPTTTPRPPPRASARPSREALAELDAIAAARAPPPAPRALPPLGQWSDPELPPGTMSLFGGYSPGARPGRAALDGERATPHPRAGTLVAMPPVISVQHLQKRYKDFVAVADASFEVAQGEIFGLLGSNGAGKTTSVECLQGLRHADGGDLRVLGHGPADAGPRAAPPHRLAAAGVVTARSHPRVGGARPVLGHHARRARLARGHGAVGPRATSARPPSTRSPAGSASACSSPWRWSTARSSSSSTR